MQIFRHIYGLNRRFIKLENRAYWLPLNDEYWQSLPENSFALTNEPLYFPFPLPPKAGAEIWQFDEVALAANQKLLDKALMQELMQDLQAAEDEWKLEMMLEHLSKLLEQNQKDKK